VKKSERIITDLEHLVYENQYAKVYDNDVTFPNYQKGKYLKFQWTAPHGVCVLPILEDGRFYFVRNFRYASDRFCIEIPKGFGSHGVEPRETASRELLEETGLTSDDFRYVACLETEPGLMKYSIHLFEAHAARPFAPPSPESSEVLSSPLIVDLAEALRLVRQGEITDSLSINALLLYQAAKCS
jgi:ADP-ribose pyrophosphatase